MGRQELEQTARELITEGKGILAADETVPTLTKRFDALKIASTEDSRRTYREMFFTTPGAAAFISGVILQDETIRQKNAAGIPLTEVLSKQGIIPGIKVDSGAKVLAGSPDEKVTEGLDGLRDRLKEYAAMGARFAKWRAVIRITDRLPGPVCVNVNAHALARYAALCQEQGIVPIVEPEVLMDGSHTIERCEEVTSSVPVRRTAEHYGDQSSRCHQSPGRIETLVDQLFIRPRPARRGAGDLAWTKGILEGKSTGLLSSGQVQQRGGDGPLYRRAGARTGRCE